MQNKLQDLRSVFERRFVGFPIGWNSYDSLVPVYGSNGFLNYVEYSPDRIDPKTANEYFRTNTTQMGMCSGVFKEGKVLRHFDWTYDDSAQFIVKMKKDESRGVLFDSIGMSFTTPVLSRDAVRNVIDYGMYNQYFDILPYTMVDGINSAGIYVQSNVVPMDGAENVDINPGGTDCCIQMMLVRFLLDRLNSISNLRNVLDQFHLYSTRKIDGYGIHLMVADKRKSCIIEFENDRYEILTRFPIISNFRVNRGFKVQSIANRDFTPKWDTIEPHGMGVERWEIMSEFLKENGDFIELRRKLNYTNTYDKSREYPWLTEVSYGDQFTTEKALDVHQNGESSQFYLDYMDILDKMHQKYTNRSRHARRNDRTW